MIGSRWDDLISVAQGTGHRDVTDNGHATALWNSGADGCSRQAQQSDYEEPERTTCLKIKAVHPSKTEPQPNWGGLIRAKQGPSGNWSEAGRRLARLFAEMV